MKGCVVNVRNKLLTGKIWTLQVGEDKVNDNFSIQKLGRRENGGGGAAITYDYLISANYNNELLVIWFSDKTC